jgi:hypothetical protein
VWTATDAAAALAAYATVCTLIGARAARLFEVVRRAADESPEARELWETLQANRRAGAAMVVDHLVTMGGDLRHGLSRDRAVDLIWLLNDPAHHLALVDTCRWDEPDFTAWLADQMTMSVVAPHRAGVGEGDEV